MYEIQEFRPNSKEVAVGILAVLVLLVVAFGIGYGIGLRNAGTDIHDNGNGIGNAREQLGQAVSHQQQITDGIKDAEYTSGAAAGTAQAIAESTHSGNGWSGIGYHFVIRKNGIIEQGRPIEMIGSHAYGENWHTIGVHLCGNFEYVEPTPAQIESAAYLIGWICETYNIPIHRIVGHRDLMATACPGKYLYEQMDTLRGKAAWYMQHYKHGYYEE